MTDPIADMLTRIKNAYLARHELVRIPLSKQKTALAKIFREEGFIDEISQENDKNALVIKLKYTNMQPALTNIKRVSKPGKRVYVKKHAIPKVLGGLGIAILSTPRGLMIDRDAVKKGLGGEVICAIW